MAVYVVPHVAGALEGETLNIVRVDRHGGAPGLGRDQRRPATVVARRDEAG